MPGEDSEVKKLIEARDRPAVLKISLITCRSKLKRTIILAFEGLDDKLVFSQWMSRLRPDLQYEPFTCKGKKQTLLLHEAVMRDKNGLKNGVYFFVDRDFDDLLEFDGSSHLFMTREYSIENSIVDPLTLDNIMKNEFHCDGFPEIRAAIIEMFRRDYQKFLDISLEANRRLFLASKLKLDVKKTEKIKDLAKVALGNVVPSDTPECEAVALSREPLEDEVNLHAAAFDALDPATRYRGKWALQFFMKWLEVLQDERKNGLDIFKGTNSKQAVNTSAFTIQAWASRSRTPDGLAAFVSLIPDTI